MKYTTNYVDVTNNHHLIMTYNTAVKNNQSINQSINLPMI